MLSLDFRLKCPFSIDICLYGGTILPGCLDGKKLDIQSIVEVL